MRARLLLLALALTALVGAPARAVADDEPPVLSNGSVLPSALPNTGGTVTLTIDVTDDVGLTDVSADAASTDGQYAALALTHSGGDTYTATFDAPPNWTDSPVGWQFTVRATDTGGHVTEGSAGEITVDQTPPFDEAPLIGETQVAPTALPAAGGPVTIEMQASDLGGISYAFAVVTLPDGSEQSLDLEPTDFTHFRGVYTAPANTSTAPQSYAVTVAAQDDIGQETRADAGRFTVAARASTGRLVPHPGAVSFGMVQVGRTALRPVLVVNTGREAVTATARTGAGPFSVVGGAAPFTLQPGQSRLLLVAFRPASAGVASGALRLVRPDGGQPGLAVALSGRAHQRP